MSTPLLATAVPSALPCTPLSAPTVELAHARRGSKTQSCRRRRARRQAGAAARPLGPPMRRVGRPRLPRPWRPRPRLWTTMTTTSRFPTRRRSGAARSCRTAGLQLCIPAILCCLVRMLCSVIGLGGWSQRRACSRASPAQACILAASCGAEMQARSAHWGSAICPGRAAPEQGRGGAGAARVSARRAAGAGA